MVIEKSGSAFYTESSEDAQITVEPGGGKVELIESSVIHQFGKQIRR